MCPVFKKFNTNEYDNIYKAFDNYKVKTINV